MRFWAGFLKALRNPPLGPTIILGASFIGFGALAKGTGFGLLPALYTTIFVFALPGQVVLVDQVTRDLPLYSATLAVALTAVRLLPMTVTIMPQLRRTERPTWLDYLASHFVAITLWIESARRLPHLPRAMRLPYYFGMATVLITASTTGTIIGFFAAGVVPRSVAGALLFVTPLYFFLGMLSAARRSIDYVPLILGFTLWPVFSKIAPSMDLLLTGLIGGTVAFLLGQRERSRTPPEPTSMTQP